MVSKGKLSCLCRRRNMFKGYSQEKKRRIAIGITIVIAFLLIMLLVLVYTVPRFSQKKRPDLGDTIRGVYTTIINKAQSSFSKK